MIRVLNIMAWGLNCGGAETRLMNYYRNIDYSKIQFDFLMPGQKHETDYYYKEAISLGAIIHPGSKSSNLFARTLRLYHVLKENPDYKIIIVHHDKPKIAFYTAIAKLRGVPVRVVDSCNEIPDMPFSLKIFRPLLRATATHFMSVSEKASKSMFGKKPGKEVTLFKQARDLELYRYSPQRRIEMRKKLDLNDELVIFNIGNLRKQKNHAFLIDVFALVHKENQKAVLLIAGKGDSENLSELQSSVKDLGLDDSVCFLGQRSDIPDLLQAADIFCLPSINEGFPGVATEVQAAGLPCLISNTISQEARALDSTEFLPIDEGPGIWVKRILAHKDFHRHDTMDIMRNIGYDIRDAALWLEGFLLKSLENNAL